MIPESHDDAWTADAMADQVNDNTVLAVGPAPRYPQGVIDDIAVIAVRAAQFGANHHVDGCMGGFVLPFVERLGREVTPWDFRVDGVISISADVHKAGHVPKGVSPAVETTTGADATGEPAIDVSALADSLQYLNLLARCVDEVGAAARGGSAGSPVPYATLE